MEVVNHEAAIDAFPPKEAPDAGLTLAQLQQQMEEELKRRFAEQQQQQQRAAGDMINALEEQMKQYMQIAIANEVKRQELADMAAKADTTGFPYIAAGFVTPQSNFPTNLTATYNGSLNGSLTNSTPVSGTLTMTVNFASLGTIPGSITFANGQGSASFGLSTTGSNVAGQMTGTYAGQTLLAGSAMSGKFYGPSANEVGGSWQLNTGTVSGGGQFAAKR